MEQSHISAEEATEVFKDVARTTIKGPESKDYRKYKLYHRTYREQSDRRDAMKRYHKGSRGKKLERNRRQRLKLECLIAYGGDPPICACCGEANMGFLSIDHVNNDGRMHRRALGGATNWQYLLKKRGWPNDPPLQVLCYNCNCGRAFNGGICPHKDPKFTNET